MTQLDAIFKAYDVRGLVPDQFDPTIAHAIGVGFARFVLGDADQGAAPTRVLVARDMRASMISTASVARLISRS